MGIGLDLKAQAEKEEKMSEPKIELSEYSYEDLAAFAKQWAEENDMDADMMQGVLQLGINSYESSYTGYSLAMQAFSNHQEENKDD